MRLQDDGQQQPCKVCHSEPRRPGLTVCSGCRARGAERLAAAAQIEVETAAFVLDTSAEDVPVVLTGPGGEYRRAWPAWPTQNGGV